MHDGLEDRLLRDWQVVGRLRGMSVSGTGAWKTGASMSPTPSPRFVPHGPGSETALVIQVPVGPPDRASSTQVGCCPRNDLGFAKDRRFTVRYAEIL